ncbi:MAG: TonB-dependent receptor, partial [Rhizobacter sp.]|nr:TonB-dependent receptor [Rhizobacter sp.]
MNPLFRPPSAARPGVRVRAASPLVPSPVTALLLAAGLLAPLAAAQAQVVQPDPLPAVVVTATRASQPIADALPHTTLITRDDIDRSQALDLPTLLAYQAGLQFTSNGGRGSVTGVFMRGAPSRQVLVLVDGIPLSKQDASGAVSIEQIMLDQVERVEIVRGNVSAIYGSGAIGGVIQVFTRQGTVAPQGRVSVEAGSRGFAKLSAGASGRGDRIASPADDEHGCDDPAERQVGAVVEHGC